MITYYTSVTILSWLSLGVLCLLVNENARIQRKDKTLLYLTYALIAVSALAEYCGVMLSGKEDISRKAILFVKTSDYILTPMAGGAIIFQMRLRNRWNRFIIAMLAFNTVLQLVSIPGGWMVRIDEHNQYIHGQLYPLYFGICLAVIGLVMLQFILYGRAFHKQNRKSLYAIMVLVFVGILIQELSGGQDRTSYLALTFGASLIFIHYVEFGAQEMDDSLRKKQLQLETDALTGTYSRFAYSHALNELEEKEKLPTKLAVFTVDINGLKQVNDQMGHEVGDELICGAAECIMAVLGANGQCYRTGGDEFVVLTSMDREEAENALARLHWEADRWRGKTLRKLSLSAGFALAAENEGLSAEKLVGEADKAMYKAKSDYYRQNGVDRRRRG